GESMFIIRSSNGEGAARMTAPGRPCPRSYGRRVSGRYRPSVCQVPVTDCHAFWADCQVIRADCQLVWVDCQLGGGRLPNVVMWARWQSVTPFIDLWDRP